MNADNLQTRLAIGRRGPLGKARTRILNLLRHRLFNEEESEDESEDTN